MFSPTFSVTYGSCIRHWEWLHDLYIILITCLYACSSFSYKEKLILSMPSSLMQLHMKMEFLSIEDGL